MVLVAIMVLMIVIGIKRGFVRSFFKCTKMLIVIILTSIVGAFLTGICQEAFVNDMFEGKISTFIVDKALESEGEIDLDSLIEQLPPIAKSVVSMSMIQEYFDSTDGSTLEIAKKVGAKVERLVIRAVSKMAAYIIAFIATFIVCSIIILIIEKFCELPIISGVNKLLGLIWGLSGAYITVSVLVFFLSLFAGMDFIEGTIVSRLIYKIGLFTA